MWLARSLSSTVAHACNICTPLARFSRFAPSSAAMLLMFFLEYYGMLSGGALGALMVGLTTSNFWERGFPRFASLGPSFNYSPEGARAQCLCAVRGTVISMISHSAHLDSPCSRARAGNHLVLGHGADAVCDHWILHLLQDTSIWNHSQGARHHLLWCAIGSVGCVMKDSGIAGAHAASYQLVRCPSHLILPLCADRSRHSHDHDVPGHEWIRLQHKGKALLRVCVDTQGHRAGRAVG